MAPAEFTQPEQSNSSLSNASESAASPPPSRPRASWQRRVGRTGGVIAMIYVGLCGVLMALETRLVFPGAYISLSGLNDPNRFSIDGPAIGKVTRFEYVAEDGAAIAGRILVHPSPDRVMLFLHGNGIRAVTMDEWTQRLSRAFGATVLTAEYRGFSDDGHTPSESTVIADAISALDALAATTSTPIEDIVVYGRSLGGGVAAGVVRATMDRGTPTQQLILDRTFDSVENVAASQFWFMPIRWLLRNRFDSQSRLTGFAGRVIQIHGPPDRIVPMRFGRALHESLTTRDKHWIEVPGMRHNDRIPKSALDQAAAKLTPPATTRAPGDVNTSTTR